MTRSVRTELVVFALALQAVAIAIGFAVLLAWPAPAPERTTIAAAVSALAGDDGSHERRTSDDAPATTSSALLSRSVAAALGIDAGRVRATWLADVLTPAGSGRHVANIGGHEALIDATASGFTLKSGNDVLLPPTLPLPSFAASVRGDDGRWLTVSPHRPWLAWWQWRGLVAFALAALVVAPIAWFASRRVVRPLRALADRVEHLAAATDAPPAAAVPREVGVVATAIARLRSRLDAEVGARVLGIAQLAHDLRTPLTSLRLRLESVDADERDAMIDDVTRMARYVDRMLAQSRGGDLDEPATRFDLAALVRECATDPGFATKPPSIAEPLPAVAFPGPREALRRVLFNLVENASAHAAHVWIALRIDDDAIRIVVDDDGPGVDTDDAALLLAPFTRGANARANGTGLGLSIVAQLVAAFGGTLALQAREGGGLSAVVALPREAD